ncbi:MAG: MoxR family ATPase [Actinomycetota bacterium]
MATDDLGLFQSWFTALIDSACAVVKGKRNEIGIAYLALFAEGHVLFEDNPGTGKTTLAKSLAATIGGDWNRVQFTPDLLPADVTGGMIFNQKDASFDFRPGPVFANVVLADEINRASPKTQSALLQVMEEGQVTVDGSTFDVKPPFIVLATQNPIEQEGTYRLPEAQLDRFLIKLSLGYPDHEAEIEMLESVSAGRKPEDLQPTATTDVVTQLIGVVRGVYVDRAIHDYIVKLCAFTRSRDHMPEVRLGASPRGAVGLMKMSRAMAASQARDYVTPDDVKRVAPYVLGHRLLLTPDAELKGVTTSELVHRVVDGVEPPEPART